MKQIKCLEMSSRNESQSCSTNQRNQCKSYVINKKYLIWPACCHCLKKNIFLGLNRNQACLHTYSLLKFVHFVVTEIFSPPYYFFLSSEQSTTTSDKVVVVVAFVLVDLPRMKFLTIRYDTAVLARTPLWECDWQCNYKCVLLSPITLVQSTSKSQ